MQTVSAPLYEQVAEKVQGLIDCRTLRAGERLPSVRALSREWNVSITTVMQAYRTLENRGLIAARPQSGFYVVPSMRTALPEPRATQPKDIPCDVSLPDLALRVLQDMHDPRLAQFGAAIQNPDLLPTRRLHQMLGTMARRHPDRAICYSMMPGSVELRTEIARRMVTAGCALSPDDILVTNGCQEATTLALRAVTKPGDAIAMESPAFYNHLLMADALGLRVVEIPTHPRDGMSVEALRYALANHRPAAVLTVSNYHNPTGARIPDERKREIARLAMEHDVPFIEDDIYGELSFDQERPKVAKAYDATGNVMLCSSFSKSLAPGYRIGWIVPGKYARRVGQLKSCLNYGSNSLAELAIAAFLEEGGYDHHLRKLRRTLEKKVAWVREAVARHFPAGTRVSNPSGGMVVWVEMAEKTDSMRIYREAVKNGIAIAPGVLFSPRGEYRNCLRLNASFAEEKHDAALAKLGEIVKAAERR